jgi:hypothetical protein
MKGSEKMKLEEFFKKIGFDISGIIGEYSETNKYLSWYRGFVDSFHKYYVYNGERQVFKNRYSLSIPKKICENFADFLMNERVKITLGKDESTKIINDILQINNFWVKANQGIEKTFALGTGCFLLSLDKQKGVKIQFISGGGIYPLTYDNDKISECAFVNDTVRFNRETKHSEKIRNVQTHTLENEIYIIRNFRFIVGEGDNLTKIPVDDIVDRLLKNGVITASAQYRIWKLQQLGYHLSKIQAYIKKMTKYSDQEIDELFRLWVKIVEISSFTPAIGGGERYYQLIWTTTAFPNRRSSLF